MLKLNKQSGTHEKVILLITGAIDITPYEVPETQLTQLTERLTQYLFSIEYAIDNYDKINHIIFCENTNYPYDYSELQKKANQKGKMLEIITFMGDYDTIQKKGKGYGEGEIIEYAFKKSKVLQESNFFYKLTGRIIVRNMNQIIESTHSKNAFIFYFKLLHNIESDLIMTVMYKVDTILYEQKLIDAYKEVDDRNNYYLEHIFFNRLSHLSLISFGKYPFFDGISGSTGQLYTISKRSFIKIYLINKLNGFSNIKKSLLQRIIFNTIKRLTQMFHLFN